MGKYLSNPLKSHWDTVTATSFLGIALMGLTVTLRPDLWPGFWSWLQFGQSDVISIGSLTRRIGEVRVRSESSFVWRDIVTQDIPVADGDTVFTGETGESIVRLKMNPSVVLLPKSLVVIHELLLLEKGRLNVNLLAGQGSQTFYANKMAVTLQALEADTTADLDFNDVKGEMKITTTGKIQISAPQFRGRPVTLTAQDEFKTQIDKPAEYSIGQKQTEPTDEMKSDLKPPQFVGPVANATISIPQSKSGEPFPITLHWETRDPRAKTELELVPIAGGPTVTRHIEKGNGISIPLNDGEYMWRLKGENSGWSQWQKFKVLSQEANQSSGFVAGQVIQKYVVGEIEILPTIRLNSNVTNTRIKTESDLERLLVRLNWKPIRDVEEYHVTVFRGNGSVLVRQSTREPSIPIMLTSLQEDAYKFQVEAKQTSGHHFESKVTGVVIQLADPLLKEPASGTIVTAGQSVLLTWEKTSLTPSYRVQVSTHSHFQSSVTTETVTDNAYGIPTRSRGYSLLACAGADRK